MSCLGGDLNEEKSEGEEGMRSTNTEDPSARSVESKDALTVES